MKYHPAKTQQMAEAHKENHLFKNKVKVHALVADFGTSKLDDDELIAWEDLLVDLMAIGNTTCASTDAIESVQDFVTHVPSRHTQIQPLL